ncbi:MAG: 30S ribosomal protein S13 [Candidatus Hydrogenedentes bacterium]|jgi:small subunit ribosomal protein S13|nr:30S ribosomal protein S13 [Candidatus Hydrogenedentota bacterium]
MARVLGVDLPREKKVEIGLTYVFGVGRSRAKKILEVARINPDTRVRDLTEQEVSALSSAIQQHDYKVEGELRRELTSNVKRLVDIGTYRGLRHRRGLPVRGQRTRTNARTRKGPAKSVRGSRKKTPVKK